MSDAILAPPAAPPAAPAAPPAGDPPPAAPSAGAAPPAAPPAKPADPPPAAPPVAYDLKPSKPDALPEAAVAQVADIAKELGLSQDAAQKLLARHEAAFAQAIEARTKQSDAWYDQIAADPDLGGSKLPATIDAARKGLSVLSEAERAEIISGGYQNHPVLVKLLARVGGSLGEGSVPNLPGSQPPVTAKAFFPSMPNP